MPINSEPGIHEKRFATYLELAHAGPSESKRIIDARVPRELAAYDNEGKVVKVRELLKSEAINGTTLIQTEFYNTIIEGASLVKAMRQAVPKFGMISDSTRIPFRSSSGYMAESAEGAPAKVNEADYEYRDFEAKDFREMSFITQNMIDDCKYDIIAEEVKHHGERAENTMNYRMLGVMLENSGLEHDTDGSNQGIKAIGSAKGKVKAAGFMPDSVVMCTDAETAVGQEFVLTNYAGAQMALNGTLPPMLGLQPYVVGTSTSSSTYTWDYDTDGEIGMMVYDSRVAGKIGMRQDITVEKYRDPVKDLVSAIIKMRFAVNYGLANSMCRVEY